MTSTENLLVELLVEELPPKALQKLGQAFAEGICASLQSQGLLTGEPASTVFATPRRLALHLTGVKATAEDKPLTQKLMPVSVGLKDGQATPALTKKLAALGRPGTDVQSLRIEGEGKNQALYLDSMQAGASLQQDLQKALSESIRALPIPKVMTYQLETGVALPGWDSVAFVRPAHGLLALHGSAVVDVEALGLKSGRTTMGHRFEGSREPLSITHADDYETQLREQGAVIASYTQRRDAIARQLQQVAESAGEGLRPIEDDALLDEVTSLVEWPNVLLCSFEAEFLQVPQECLILTMKANQKYFPLLDAQGRLSNRFLVVSNIRPEDPAAVVSGNERVVRPRLADARFFFEQDRRKSLEQRLPQLARVVYHNRLGSQGERSERVRAIAATLAGLLAADAGEVDTAARLAKADLNTDMVGEFPELQGIMGRYYALNDGLPETVANAIEDHYKPRFAGDSLPRSDVARVVALADKLETLGGLFSIGQLPTGDADPFALRRHALGIIRMVIEGQDQQGTLENLTLEGLVQQALAPFATPPGAGAAQTQEQLCDFFLERLHSYLAGQGHTRHEIDAVLAKRPVRLRDVPALLGAVHEFNILVEAQALAAANKRVGNILKKADRPVTADINEALLQEPAEQALYQALQQVETRARLAFEQRHYAASLQALAVLKGPIDGFFDDVMVNAEDPALKANRLGLLKSLHDAMNQVADLSRLAI